MTALGGDASAAQYAHEADHRRNGTDGQPGLLDQTRAWVTVLFERAYWSMDRECRPAYRSGVLLAQWTAKQVRLSGLCATCWMQESDNGVHGCEGGNCRTFTRLLEKLTEGER